ncbi:PTS lactose/cellobiose transporter subunit IIA [Bacillus sp. Bva_UNVM-123]|uniref:PTS lactose/cellobiose transporter subunit IIA n=1 Tax=Bacillus sp. Bva_UNVM-123 TaxID=2829798 RepID=UPI00391F03F0
MENLEQIIFHMILHGGNGRSSAMEAIAAAREANFVKAKEKLQESAEAIVEAHKVQTALIQAELQEEKAMISLLMVHAQDHLMNAMTIKDLAAEFVHLYEIVQAEK